MLRNGFKNFYDRRITKPKQSLISVLYQIDLFSLTEKSSDTCRQFYPAEIKRTSVFNKMCCGNLLCIMTSIS